MIRPHAAIRRPWLAPVLGLVLGGCGGSDGTGRGRPPDEQSDGGVGPASDPGRDVGARTGPDGAVGSGSREPDAPGAAAEAGSTPDQRSQVQDAPGEARAASDGAASADAPKGDGAVAARFECTQVHGFNVTGDWFDAGFEKLVDGDRWQVKGVHLALIENWANPNHPLWRESGCDPNFSPCATRSKCAGGRPPDRILFVTETWDYASTTQPKWESGIKQAMETIRTKYPTVKRIELMTFPRSPEGQSCGGRSNISTNHTEAQKALAASSNGTVTVAPVFRVMSCSQFAGPPYLTTAGNRYMADLIGRHYAREN